MHSVAERLREAGVHVPQKTILKGGETSEFYIDVKKVFGKPELLGYITAQIVDVLDVDTTCIAASGHGGLPLATAVSLDSGIPFTLVRDIQKQHGLSKRIDGYAPQDSPIPLHWLVDAADLTGQEMFEVGLEEIVKVAIKDAVDV